MSKTRFYDLEAEANARIADAERKHQDKLILAELAAIREATQSFCALMMGLNIRQVQK